MFQITNKCIKILLVSDLEMENVGMWPGPLPGSLPVAAMPLVSPVQGNVKGK